MSRVLLFVAFYMLSVTLTFAQCSLSSGTQIVDETFGSGTNNIGAPLASGITNLQYIASTCPNDGQYSIIHSTANCFSNTWHTVTNHTGDPNGYFMAINASYDPNTFFVQTIDGLCAGTTFQFSAWVINLDSIVQILPNITFIVQTPSGDVIASYSTGDIPTTTQPAWKKYAVFFQTPPGITSVKLTIRNNAPGGNGNDIGLDDIAFSPAGPQISIATPGAKSDSLINYCYPKNVTLSAAIGNCYTQNAYQWQTSNDGVTWNDIAGAIDSNYNFNVVAPGTRLYRLEVAQTGNMGNINCRSASQTFTVVNKTPYINNIAATICFNKSYTLAPGKTYNKSGVYRDTLRTAQGCDSLINILSLTVAPPPTQTKNISICEGQDYLGHTITGTYIDTVPGIIGCDTINTIHLTVKKRSYSTIAATICADKSYFGHTKTGTFVDTLIATNGCDSIRTLNLTVLPLHYLTLNVSVCYGESYLGYTKSGTYTDTISVLNSCDSVRILNLTVFEKPKPNLGTNHLVCVNDSLILNPGVFSSYLWQDGSKTPTFTVTDAGKYRVQVTDENGCTASDSIQIRKVYCSLLNIPNTFTPNGDGINDTWEIYALQFFPACVVRIFDRSGQQVFKSVGYGTPWDGMYKGKPLPTGTYYYVIDLNNGSSPLSGYIVIIR